MIFHGREVLNTNLPCESKYKIQHSGCAYTNLTCYLKLAYYSGRQQTHQYKLSYRNKQHIIQADITRGYSVLSVGDGEDLLPLADGKAQRSRRINLLLSSWLLACDAARR